MSTLEALEELKDRLSALRQEPSAQPATPQIEDVAEAAAAAVRKIMGRGSVKSAFGEWFHRDSMRYNADRVISHTTKAMQQLDGNVPCPDSSGETLLDHAERALTRAAFVLFKLQEGQTK